VIGVGVVRKEHAAIASLVRGLEPDAVALTDAAPMWEAFDAIERQAAAAKTLLARRVDESRVWRRSGHRSAAEFLAARSGGSIGAARTQLDVSRKVEELPSTTQALRDGELSGPQVAAVVDAATANPAAEGRLLRHAKQSSLAELRHDALRARAGADADQEATHQRIHAQRRLRTWTDGEGAWNLSARGTVGDGARVVAALEPIDTHLTLVRVDLAALRRSEVHDDERCEITGLGPIPVSTARELLGDSILKLVITKGVDVLHVTHLGRGPNAAQRVALLWASPGCTVEGCPRTRVEIDHRIPYRDTRHTRLDECDPLCRHHHAQKTNDGWELVEGSGKRPMVPLGDPRHPKNRPRQDSS
jgi:hypothetical protein